MNPSCAVPESSFAVERALQVALATLLRVRGSDLYWTGELSTSALSTATAVSALASIQRATSDSYQTLIDRGVEWLVRHQNEDGGWGDTVKSVSNISTSMLVKAAFHLTGTADRHPDTLHRLESYLRDRCGNTTAEQAAAIRARYGKDRTFAVPILTTCALAGFMDWREVPALPFELACLPQSWFRFAQLPVVSYALPALIAIGQAIHHHRPSRNPVARGIRHLARSRSLRVLRAIQPSSGGYLEAAPLTSFVTLSLASIGQAAHAVAKAGVRFLVNSVREDGSWPIDTNLAIWVSTLSLNALAGADSLEGVAGLPELTQWLLDQQLRERHPYTGAAPGAWGWSHLPGSVPDADDTPGALLALRNLLSTADARLDRGIACEAADRGLTWLLDLQNRDGGWPTFCRGWGHLPFDRSGADLTAHALRALASWASVPGCRFSEGSAARRLHRARQRGLAYLEQQQLPDGSWLPLWFGNQHAPDDVNPTYGTAKVLACYRDLGLSDAPPARRGFSWLAGIANADGGWGGYPGTPSSIEETSLAVEVLLDGSDEYQEKVRAGLVWLADAVAEGGLNRAAPIGFYFAKLWYFEKLYPIVFAVAALGRARSKLSRRRDQPERDLPPC